MWLVSVVNWHKERTKEGMTGLVGDYTGRLGRYMASK